MVVAEVGRDESMRQANLPRYQEEWIKAYLTSHSPTEI